MGCRSDVGRADRRRRLARGRFLGKGGFGSVFKARNVHTDALYAVKESAVPDSHTSEVCCLLQFRRVFVLKFNDWCKQAIGWLRHR